MRIETDENGTVAADGEMSELQRNMKLVWDANLPDCLFCSGKATLTWKASGYGLQCENRFTGCPMNARTHRHVDVAVVIARWCQRAGN